MESLDLLANNVANSSTGGYKADREFYSLYAAPEAQAGSLTTMPVIEHPWIDLSQGLLQPTGNSLDLALSGKGFFTVAGPQGPLYTRNGNFHVAKGQLVTAEGYAVAGTAGPVGLPGSGPVEISPDGSVQQDGNVVGRLQLADFPAAALSKQGANYFRVDDSTVLPGQPAGTLVEQGKLEASNAGGAEGAVRLVGLLRQFEMLQKAVSLGSDMNRQAIEQVAKPGV
jgi:flagellar basal body rod protein FlgG